ncbi:MAG: D-alanyl-D-alanine carboxypeptidase/D-alanyl-D-alanine-endopeptidase [Cyanobacteria bacterium Co-bin8]|nr:D-alanyl-D-alanine carboxypeptidase/D-alanyl-D-alanine-endopeptidase [Cyanobacteria bacterium Co-bin8]
MVASAASASASSPELFQRDSLERESEREVVAQAGGFCARELGAMLDAIASQPQFASAQWGIVVEPTAEATPFYARNAQTPLIPASTLKLLTSAAALQIVAQRDPQQVGQLKPWLDQVNRESNNNSADALLRHIGGQHAVQQALVPLGVNPDSYWQVDGSGLSRQNRVQPAALVTLLKAMYTHENAPLFYYSMPLGGVNGTLRNRFRATPLVGQVRAKTGTLQGVRALSGYVSNADYGMVAFSIVINQPGQSGPVMLQAIDQMVLRISQTRRCG